MPYHLINSWKSKDGTMPVGRNGTIVFNAGYGRLSVTELIRNVKLGLDSGFPKCCVAEYSVLHFMGFPKMVETDYLEEPFGSGPGYILCIYHQFRNALGRRA